MTEPKNKSRRSTGKVTLADIAKAVGVGQMTVSRAIHKPELVSEELRNKIQQTIQTMGYIPNIAARNLATVSSNTVVLVTNSLIATENTLIMDGLHREIQTTDLQLLILLVEKEKDWINELIKYAPEMIVLLNMECNEQQQQRLKVLNIPLITIGAKQTNNFSINIGIDVSHVIHLLVTHLLQKGKREIGLLCANQHLAIFQQYMKSWHDACLEHFINPHLVLHTAEQASFKTGCQLFNEALLLWGNIDAFICLSDEVACGALFESLRRHINIPHEVSITSIGGLEVSEVSYPKLTTVHIPYREMGILAGRTLRRLSQQHITYKPENILVRSRLIVRDSA
ncbi:LacI family transcriptional regulator [Gallibacterium salpingitidis]|uniref:GntR family transcriptional regulator n=1 Tax=Gallibacterium salpingitidis TaxID=505341 RepID=A0A1A7P1Z4_9PAST|nr:LacI family DNA-binding transcriptional regulator [Gallibacterium salpingitidis]OBW96462.1 GntR family transcriptional regulator [Gallibacterium salpingitidis]WKS99380.1 LacI family transcriptional regulator [Gallibacterium salpingitidis]